MAGAVITIDGTTGEVFEGAIPGTTEVVPEARTLQAWAREQGIDVDAVGAGRDTTSLRASTPGAAQTRPVTPETCLRVIAIKGFATIGALADALLSTPADVEPIVDQLSNDGLTTTVAGAHRLTEAGTARADELLAAERAAWGPAAAVQALDAFLDLDHPVKDAVTAWQLRDDAAGQVINDHTDPAYDADGPRPPGRPARRRGGLDHAARDVLRTPRRLSHPAGPGPRGGTVGRRALRRVTTGRQLPRHLVRAARGPDPARRPDPRGGGRGRPRRSRRQVVSGPSRTRAR